MLLADGVLVVAEFFQLLTLRLRDLCESWCMTDFQ